MKRIALSVAAAAFASSSYAADTVAMQTQTQTVNPFTGHVEGYIGGVRFSIEDMSENLTTYGGAARLNYMFNQRWNIQGDFFADALSDDGESIYSYGGAAHLYWRDPASYAFGIFGSLEGYGASDDGDFLDDIHRYTVGPEGQVYFGNFTLYGQAYFGQIRADDADESLDLWGVRAVGRYFVRENIRLDGELGFTTMDIMGADLDTFTLAVQANYRFTGTPITVFGRYQFENTSVSVAPVDFDSHKFVAGLRLSFGTGSLLEEDRYGPTMDVARPNLTLPLPIGF